MTHTKKSNTSDSAIALGMEHLLRSDPSFASIMENSPPCSLGRAGREPNHFADLVDSVVAQQLSTKAADTISGRLKAQVDNELTPARILALDEEQLRGVGLSRAKTRTIRGLADSLASGALALEPAIAAGDDHHVRAELMKLWGIGRWTTEMFLIFTLNRLDVWPVGDLAMRRGWQEIHGDNTATPPPELETLGEPLRPYRSIAAWYCWRQVDGDNPSW